MGLSRVRLCSTRWHHELNEHESEQAPGAADGRGSLAYCSPWGRKELTELNAAQHPYNYSFIYSL